MTLPENPTDDDLVDPLGGPLKDFTTTAARIDELLLPIVERIAPA
jgi:hypothetical protein